MATAKRKDPAEREPPPRRPGAKSAHPGAPGRGSEERSFRARLEPDHTSLKWVIARVPFDVSKTWATMHRLRVRGEINGFAFRTSLFPLPGAQVGHFVLVNKSMQAGAGVRVGMEADIVLEPDLAVRPAELPIVLKAAFDGDRHLLRYTEALSESMRREIGKWIAGVKGPDAQARRAAQMAERLLLAMEAEHETPPVLEVLFKQTPRARGGWNAMTPAQRRSHLLGIFYYQTPEARTRRAEKAIDQALRVADKL